MPADGRRLARIVRSGFLERQVDGFKVSHRDSRFAVHDIGLSETG